MQIISRFIRTLFILMIITVLSSWQTLGAVAYAETGNSDAPVYTTLRSIDLGTFNEYRYRITEQFFNLREHFEVYQKLDVPTMQNIALLANEGFKYLPNNLKNQNYLRELLQSLKKWVESPNNTLIYGEIIDALAAYLEKVEIDSISWDIVVNPKEGNAPLSVTFRSEVTDPSGTQIKSGSYTWWVDVGGTPQVIGRGPSVNYTFREQGTFTVFLDVTSSHRNAEGNTDVLPFRQRAEVVVKEKVASLIVKVNGEILADNAVLKFTPEDAGYGLLFDATSSTPTGGAQFVETSWDFGNGVIRKYRWGPRIERIAYGREGEYTVRLSLVTNEGKVIEKDFILSIRDPIATIEVNSQDGYIGDKFTFSAKDSGFVKNLTYNWEIIDIDEDRVIFQKTDKTFSYEFVKKGRFNVKLKVRQPSGEIDTDTRIVYITSQAPVAEYESKKPYPHKPNTVLLDASKTHDPDFSDDGNLKYTWYIDGKRTNLENASLDGSVGYYTFDSIGNHSVNLEVIDPDGIMALKKGEVKIDSILSVEMFAFPRVIQREGFIKFTAESPEAEVYEWDFGDGQTTGGDFDKVTHTYEKSGKFDVTLQVSDGNNNTNSYKQTVYVSESGEPYAHIATTYGGLDTPIYDANACNGAGAYVVDRVNNLKFDAGESINIDGQTTGLEYSWKIGQAKFATSPSVTHTFDEIGCFPVKLTVKSKKNNATHSQEVIMDVRNMMPRLSSLDISIDDPEADPLVVRVAAEGAEDPDGVIQSYLWYYYTDTDSEPQDFRSTASPQTAFVIPKVTGNYYFVAILKDNNEARVTSEEVTGSRYFKTITGDNINTPIVQLSVDDSSTVVGDEITFTAAAHNVLGKSIEKDAQYSWDFDGDGFYDMQTTTPTVSYRYLKSGEFHAKVKVKYRGISGTKNITVQVNNELRPDFGYISVGNKFIFFDNSTGQIDARSWDLGDGTKKSGTNFEHVYTDKAPIHTVTLKISEGTTTKDIKKPVKKNIRNMVGIGNGFSVMTYPQATNGEITLESPLDQVFVYMGESGAQVAQYGIDYDIEYDSDFSGAPNDDADNKDSAGYTTGEITMITLNEYPTQTIRAYTKDAEGNILGAEDIKINKTYITQEVVNPDFIVFENVSETEKEKIEQLKTLLDTLPQQQKIEAYSYVQRLQESWTDPTEKTRSILDFESYLFELQLSNEDEIISVLESLLVEGQEDQSEREIAYQALVGLTPQDIVCEAPEGSCYDMILAKLAEIRASNDPETNKALGKEVLNIIAGTDLMTNQQKLDFKAILTALVYGGDVTQIPEAEKQEVMEENPNSSVSESTGGGSGIMWIFVTIFKIIFFIFLIFAFIVWWLFIAYKILNKNKDVSFSQFITNITSFSWEKKSDTSQTTDTQTKAMEDILWEVEDTLGWGETTPTQKTDPIPDPLADTTPSQPPQPAKQPTDTSFTQTDPSVSAPAGEGSQEEVPDWLKGNFDTLDSDTTVASTDNTPAPQSDISSSSAEATDDKKSGANTSDTQKTQETPKSEETLDDITKVEENAVPDWLKGSFDATNTPAPNEEISSSVEVNDDTWEMWGVIDSETSSEWQSKEVASEWQSTEEKAEEAPQKAPETSTEAKDTNTPDTTESPENVPDWLKGSFETPSETLEVPDTPSSSPEGTDDTQKTETTSDTKTSDTPKPKKATSKKKTPAKSSATKTTDEKQSGAKKSSPKKQAPATSSSKTSKKTTSAISTGDTKKTETTSDTKTSDTPDKKPEQKDESLWSDTDMKIPDWLKIDDDDTPSTTS